MGRSVSSPTADNAIEGTFYHRASGRYYSMVERNGQWFQRRHQIGFDGKESNIIERQVDYVIGSGNHARTYLHRNSEGKLIELPVSWYSENGGYWAMSPGYDRPDQQDFRRAIAFNCVFCHDAYPRDSGITEPVFREQLPQGIDCQRCDGPGPKHTEAAGTGTAP